MTDTIQITRSTVDDISTYYDEARAREELGSIDLIGTPVRSSVSCPGLHRVPSLEKIAQELEDQNRQIDGVVCIREYDSYWIEGGEGWYEDWQAFRQTDENGE